MDAAGFFVTHEEQVIGEPGAYPSLQARAGSSSASAQFDSCKNGRGRTRFSSVRHGLSAVDRADGRCRCGRGRTIGRSCAISELSDANVLAKAWTIRSTEFTRRWSSLDDKEGDNVAGCGFVATKEIVSTSARVNASRVSWCAAKYSRNARVYLQEGSWPLRHAEMFLNAQSAIDAR